MCVWTMCTVFNANRGDLFWEDELEKDSPNKTMRVVWTWTGGGEEERGVK